MAPKRRQEILDVLNEALTYEHAAAIRYFTQAATVRGLMSEGFKQKFMESAMEEIEHAKRLRDRIVTLGGTPTTRVAEIKSASKVKEMVRIDAEGEARVAELYIGLMKRLDRGDDLLLYETIEHIVEDTLKDLEDYERLLSDEN